MDFFATVCYNKLDEYSKLNLEEEGGENGENVA